MKQSEKLMLIDDNITSNYFNLHLLKNKNLEKEILLHDSVYTALSYLNRNKNNVSQLPKSIFFNTRMNMFNLTDFLRFIDGIKNNRNLSIKVVLITEKNETSKLEYWIQKGLITKVYENPMRMKDVILLED